MEKSYDNEKQGEDNENNFEDIRLENEIKKIKLSLEYGMDLSNQLNDPDLPPEVEGQFLDYIQQFEAQFAQQKTILVYDLAGKPEWKRADEIPDSEINSELDRIITILHEHSISIETICDVEERELYRFITEELFLQETNDIQIEGMTHGFIYEEFHPNHDYDIKNRCKEFIDFVLSNKEELPDCWALGADMQTGGKTFSKEEFRHALSFFRDSFSSFSIREFDNDCVGINELKDRGTASYNIDYSGNIEGSAESMDFKGKCTFHLECEHGWWVVSGFEIPGIAL